MGACIRWFDETAAKSVEGKGERLCVVSDESDSIEGLAVFSGSVGCQARQISDRCR